MDSEINQAINKAIDEMAKNFKYPNPPAGKYLFIFPTDSTTQVGMFIGTKEEAEEYFYKFGKNLNVFLSNELVYDLDMLVYDRDRNRMLEVVYKDGKIEGLDDD